MCQGCNWRGEHIDDDYIDENFEYVPAQGLTRQEKFSLVFLVLVLGFVVLKAWSLL